jgi:hypothetical protein
MLPFERKASPSCMGRATVVNSAPSRLTGVACRIESRPERSGRITALALSGMPYSRYLGSPPFAAIVAFYPTCEFRNAHITKRADPVDMRFIAEEPDVLCSCFWEARTRSRR